jgi:hypothetical protein
MRVDFDLLMGGTSFLFLGKTKTGAIPATDYGDKDSPCLKLF